jgi:hypothetical protein
MLTMLLFATFPHGHQLSGVRVIDDTCWGGRSMALTECCNMLQGRLLDCGEEKKQMKSHASAHIVGSKAGH